MKKIILLLMVCWISIDLFSQSEKQIETAKDTEFSCLTVGVLQGGGSLVGIDFEALITDRIGLQAGVGFVGFGAGINYHFKPSIRSSFVSLQYWNQGLGETFTQNVLGVNYVFRGKKWLTFQIGLGRTLSKGPAFPENIEQSPVILMYSIGAYFTQ